MALILIVDDSPTEVFVMQKALEKHGFKTAAAENGEEASFFSYVPLTSRFVEERSQELCSLPSFGPAREAACIRLDEIG